MSHRRHCEERSDEAIHAATCRAMDCFACARNDGIDFRDVPGGPRQARPDDRERKHRGPQSRLTEIGRARFETPR